MINPTFPFGNSVVFFQLSFLCPQNTFGVVSGSGQALRGEQTRKSVQKPFVLL